MGASSAMTENLTIHQCINGYPMDKHYPLNKLKDLDGDREQILNGLIDLYERMGQNGKEVLYLHQMMVGSDNSHIVSHRCFRMGLAMEKLDKYKSAALFYSRALILEHHLELVMYFSHNNRGYCLNILGRFEDAEKVCREAITINPGRSNAYKNPGMSLEMQGRFTEAADSYRTGIIADFFDNDPRPRQYLENLLSKHPELPIKVPGAHELIEERKKLLATINPVKEKCIMA